MHLLEQVKVASKYIENQNFASPALGRPPVSDRFRKSFSANHREFTCK